MHLSQLLCNAIFRNAIGKLVRNDAWLAGRTGSLRTCKSCSSLTVSNTWLQFTGSWGYINIKQCTIYPNKVVVTCCILNFRKMNPGSKHAVITAGEMHTSSGTSLFLAAFKIIFSKLPFLMPRRICVWPSPLSLVHEKEDNLCLTISSLLIWLIGIHDEGSTSRRVRGLSEHDLISFMHCTTSIGSDNLPRTLVWFYVLRILIGWLQITSNCLTVPFLIISWNMFIK